MAVDPTQRALSFEAYFKLCEEEAIDLDRARANQRTDILIALTPTHCAPYRSTACRRGESRSINQTDIATDLAEVNIHVLSPYEYEALGYSALGMDPGEGYNISATMQPPPIFSNLCTNPSYNPPNYNPLNLTLSSNNTMFSSYPMHSAMTGPFSAPTSGSHRGKCAAMWTSGKPSASPRRRWPKRSSP